MDVVKEIYNYGVWELHKKTQGFVELDVSVMRLLSFLEVISENVGDYRITDYGFTFIWIIQ